MLSSEPDFYIHDRGCRFRRSYGREVCSCDLRHAPQAEEVVETPFGKFLLTRGDLIDETTRAGTLWDGPGFLQVIAKEYGHLGEPGVTVLDVGAHHGAFSIWLAAHGAWRVLAVEPVPATRQRLKANLDLNQASCADVVVPLGVAAYSWGDLLYAPPIDPGNTGGTALQRVVEGEPSAQVPQDQLVVAAPLDSYRWLFGRQVSLIVIDAQGCDGQALRGLRETLRRDQPAVVFEWEEALAARHGDRRLPDVLSDLVTLGYATAEWPSQPHNFLAIPRRKAD